MNNVNNNFITAVKQQALKVLSNYITIFIEIVVIGLALYWYFFDKGGTESIIVGISALGIFITSLIALQLQIKPVEGSSASISANPYLQKNKAQLNDVIINNENAIIKKQTIISEVKGDVNI